MARRQKWKSLTSVRKKFAIGFGLEMRYGLVIGLSNQQTTANRLISFPNQNLNRLSYPAMLSLFSLLSLFAYHKSFKNTRYLKSSIQQHLDGIVKN